MRVKIIGAGIFGCMIAGELKRAGHEVVLIEKNSDIMQGASKFNHNRIHFGFHYPRSLPTAQQSLEGLITFFLKFKEAIVSEFPNFYMISKENSFITGEEYIYFCDRAQISYTLEYPPTSLVNRDRISHSLRVREPVFDYDILYALVKKEIKGVELRLNTPWDGESEDADFIVNASYGSINEVSQTLGAPPLTLKFQDVIIPIFTIKEKKVGLTVMDGPGTERLPFSSIMPKGFKKNTFLLYSPRHSVLSESPHNNFREKSSEPAITKMYRGAQRFFPFLKHASPAGHWRTIRALPVNDNDERLSEIFVDPSCPALINVLSGKISTCAKVALEVRYLIENNMHKSLVV